MSSEGLWDLFRHLENQPSPAREKAKALCAQYLGGHWQTAKDEDFVINKISGGMTNQMFKCDLKTKTDGVPHTVLLRIQCEKDQMQLQNEIAIFMELANSGLGPRLLGIFPGGRLEEFIPSRTLTFPESRELKYTKQVAQRMADIHQQNIPISKTPQIVQTMRDWIVRIKRNGGTSFDLWSKQTNIPKEKFPSVITLERLTEEVDYVEEYFKTCISPIAFTHNDLFCANILLRDGFTVLDDGSSAILSNNEIKKTNENALILIDFEFGMYNYRGFDIGNHMNELAYTCNEDESYTFDWNIHKDVERQRAYCRSYVQESYKILKTKSSIENFKLTGDLEKDTEDLLQEIQPFKVICNLWWGLWNCICVQEHILGLDFDNAFRDRFALYFSQKEVLRKVN